MWWCSSVRMLGVPVAVAMGAPDGQAESDIGGDRTLSFNVAHLPQVGVAVFMTVTR
jgi:hypothetical protein